MLFRTYLTSLYEALVRKDDSEREVNILRDYSIGHCETTVHMNMNGYQLSAIKILLKTRKIFRVDDRSL